MKKAAATFEFEKTLWKNDKDLVCGIDEVGRGAWAGPLVAAAVIFPKNIQIKYPLFDSKLLNLFEREKLDKFIQKSAVSVGVGQVEVEEIENLGLTKATNEAYLRAIGTLTSNPDHYLIDAFYINSLPRINQTAIIHGDYLSNSIAAASIIAKVFRDNLMKQLSSSFPQYNWINNKGYGTKNHIQAIEKFGLTPMHRKNYKLKFLNG